MPNHHFVPECYLKWFTDPSYTGPHEPQIWQGVLSRNRIKPRPIRKVASTKGFYRLSGGGGQDPDKIEKLFSNIEDAVAPVLKKLNLSDESLTGQEREDLLFFAATLAVRGPKMRASIDALAIDVLLKINKCNAQMTSEQFQRLVEASPLGQSVTAEDAQDLQKWMRDPTNFELKMLPENSIDVALKTAKETIYPIFTKMKWALLCADEPLQFLSSDCPVIWWAPPLEGGGGSGVGLWRKDVEVTFPLGRGRTLLGGWGDLPLVIRVTQAEVTAINHRTAIFAHTEILGPSRWLVEQGLAICLSRRTGNPS